MRKDIDVFRPWNSSLRDGNPGRDIFSIFNDFFTDTMRGSNIPAVDVSEVDDHFLVSADLPGVREEDIHATVEGNQLTITAERSDEWEESTGKNRRMSERYHGVFTRTFTLPMSVDADKIEASYENGVLRIAVPKGDAMKARHLNIGHGKTGLFEKLYRRSS